MNENKNHGKLINFFDQEHQTPIQVKKFGLCDPGTNKKCYASTEQKEQPNWIATVINKDNKEIIFTAIDQGVLSDKVYKGKKCDAMLTSGPGLYLIELKATEHRKKPDKRGVDQLLATIELLKQHHPDIDEKYTAKKAFVCNKNNQALADNLQDKRILLRNKYKFELVLKAEIDFK